MKVSELVKALQGMGQNLPVFFGRADIDPISAIAPQRARTYKATDGTVLHEMAGDGDRTIVVIS